MTTFGERAITVGALACALIAGCYQSHGRDGDGGRRDGGAADVPGSCLRPGTYDVSVRFEGVSPAGCFLDGMDPGSIPIHVPPRASDFSGMCGSEGTTEITELGPCTWRVFAECLIPDSSSRIEGTISTATGVVSGRFDVEISTLVGPCSATMVLTP